MAETRRAVHSVGDTVRSFFADQKPEPEDIVYDVENCVRTVVDQECGTLEEHRELGLRILNRLGISPVGPIIRS